MGYYEWINGVLVPKMMRATEMITGKKYIYDLSLAEQAARHSESMMKENRLFHTPACYLNGLAENVARVTFMGDDFDDAIWRTARMFREDGPHYANLMNFDTIGIGIAVKKDPMQNIIYVTERFRRSEKQCATTS